MDFIVFLLKYMVFYLPLFIAREGHKRFAKFLKDRRIYDGWDKWHTVLLLLFILLIVFYSAGVK